MRVIKQYKNRKLWDTSTHMYTNSKLLLEVLVRGEDIQIVDVDGVDITKRALIGFMLKHHTHYNKHEVKALAKRKRKAPCKE